MAWPRLTQICHAATDRLHMTHYALDALAAAVMAAGHAFVRVVLDPESTLAVRLHFEKRWRVAHTAYVKEWQRHLSCSCQLDWQALSEADIDWSEK